MAKETAAASPEQRMMTTSAPSTTGKADENQNRKRPLQEEEGQREKEVDSSGDDNHDNHKEDCHGNTNKNKKQRSSPTTLERNNSLNIKTPANTENHHRHHQHHQEGSPSKSSSTGTNEGTSSQRRSEGENHAKQQRQQSQDATTTTSTLPVTSKKFSEENLKILNECYKENANPTAKCLRAIARKSGLTHLQCKAWFQYQRKKKRKHILENQSEKLYKEIKVLVEDIEKAKERNVVLLTENNTLRNNVNQWNSYQEQFGVDSTGAKYTTAKPINLVVNGTPAATGSATATATATAAAAAAAVGRATTSTAMDLIGTSTLQEAKARLGLGSVTSAAAADTHHQTTHQTSPNSDSDQTQHRLATGGSKAVAVAAAAAGVNAAVNNSTTTTGGVVASSSAPFKTLQEMQSAIAFTKQRVKTTGLIPLDVNATDIPGQIAMNVSEHVKRASGVVTRVLNGQARNDNASEAVLHNNLAIHVRTLVMQSENPLNIVTVLMKSFDNLLAPSSQKTEAEKEVELRPLLDSFVKTELAIKDAQLATKVNLMAQLPQLPPPTNVKLQVQSQAAACKLDPVSVDSILCIFNQCYLGEAERSLCFMGESSLHALFSQAYDLINLENASLPFQHVMLLNKFKEELKKEEEELVRKFEVSWHLPYAFAKRHRDPLMRSHIQSAMILSGSTGGAGGSGGTGEANQQLHLSMSKIIAEAVAVYKKGIVECYKKLPATLCCRVFLSMHKVKQILRTSDSFYQVGCSK